MFPANAAQSAPARIDSFIGRVLKMKRVIETRGLSSFAGWSVCDTIRVWVAAFPSNGSLELLPIGRNRRQRNEAQGLIDRQTALRQLIWRERSFSAELSCLLLRCFFIAGALLQQSR